MTSAVGKSFTSFCFGPDLRVTPIPAATVSTRQRDTPRAWAIRVYATSGWDWMYEATRLLIFALAFAISFIRDSVMEFIGSSDQLT